MSVGCGKVPGVEHLVACVRERWREGEFECKVGDGQKGRQRDESRVMWVVVCSGRKKI